MTERQTQACPTQMRPVRPVADLDIEVLNAILAEAHRQRGIAIGQTLRWLGDGLAWPLRAWRRAHKAADLKHANPV
ncbi:MAG: hypothetical protein Kilf2KO_32670 [Rhodospirillales bacterium]